MTDAPRPTGEACNDAPAGFTSVYRPGPAWSEGRELTDQPGWDAQLAAWRALVESGRMRFLGEAVRLPGTVLVTWRGVVAEAEAANLAASVPFVARQVMTVATAPGAPVP